MAIARITSDLSSSSLAGGPDQPPIATGGTESTYTDGILYKTHTYTTSGSFTVTRAGSVQVFLCAGGTAGYGGGQYASGEGGGGAGTTWAQNVYVPVGVHTVTVGTGGASQITAGNASTFRGVGAGPNYGSRNFPNGNRGYENFGQPGATPGIGNGFSFQGTSYGPGGTGNSYVGSSGAANPGNYGAGGTGGNVNPNAGWRKGMDGTVIIRYPA